MKNDFFGFFSSKNHKVMDNPELTYPNATYLPVLYHIDKKGKERLWRVWVVGDTVHWISGLSDGKKQKYQRVYKGVNKGRSNATTAKSRLNFK